MPLSPPVGRQHLHTRRVTCQGFFREDGLWDIEGRITDEKTYEHANEWRGPLKPGDFVHDMSIRLTLDHRFTIVDVEAVTDKSPYQICGNVAPDFKKLIGLAHRRRLPPRGAGAAGRRARLHAHRRAFGPGGDHGVPDRVVAQGARPQPGPSPQDRQAAQAARSRRKPQRKPYVIDNCYAWAADGAGGEALGAALLHRPRRRSRARRRGRQRSRWTAEWARAQPLMMSGEPRPRLLVFRRRQRRERERMQAGIELGLQRGIDQALARDPALAFERRRHDLDTKMALAAFAVAGMAVMARGFILDGKARRARTPSGACCQSRSRPCPSLASLAAPNLLNTY